MIDSGADGSVRQIALPADARSQGTLPRVDYSDAFLIETSGRAASAERWARAILEDAPGAFRRSAPLAWRALGLERGPLSSDASILSWPIKIRSEQMILLSSAGRLGMSAELLVQQRPDSLLFSTMIELRNRFVRVEWASARALHQHIVEGLLRRARHRVLGSPAG